MSTKPVTKPRWALTGAGADAANVTVPSSGEQDVGWTNGQNPASSGKMNFLFNWLAKWINFLDDSPAFVPTTAGAPGLTATGNGTGPGVAAVAGPTGAGINANGGSTSGNGGNFTATNGVGVQGTGGNGGDGSRGNGNGAGAGVRGTGGATGPGLVGTGGATSGDGVQGTGTGGGRGGTFTGQGSGAGVIGTGGATGDGIVGTGGATGGRGVVGTATGNQIGVDGFGATSQPGVRGTGGATGAGVAGTGGATSGDGVQGTGTGGGKGGSFGGQGAGAGVAAQGGATGVGVVGIGGSTSGDGVTGTGTAGNARGVVGFGQGTSAGVEGIGGATGPGIAATAGGGGTPTSGALRLVPQAAPSAPANGDVWVETTTNVAKARINGATKEITTQDKAGPTVYSYNVNNPSSAPSAATEFQIYSGTNGPANSAMQGAGTPVYNCLHIVPAPGRLGTIRAQAFAAVANTQTIKVYKNGVAVLTAPTWTSGTSFSFDASTVTVVAGDLITISWQQSTALTAAFVLEMPIFNA